MIQNDDSKDEISVSGMNRYVPLLIYVIVVLSFLLIPLKIVSYGYLPPDDALRHAAKAVSGKPWSEILVLNDDYKIDHNFGWHLFLRQIYLRSHCDAEGLVVFCVVALLTLVSWSALPWLRRPEAWLGTMLLFAVSAGTIGRLTLGRPYLLTEFALLTILFAWQCRAPSMPGWRTALGMTALISVAVFVHGVWYLWALPVLAFVLARQYRWALVLGLSWLAGTAIGATFTGHPIDFIWEAVKTATKAFGLHFTQRTLVSEFQPSGGDFPALIVLGGMLVLRSLAKLEARPLLTNPAFWLTCISWLLGFKAGRFWEDWGWPALMVLVACDLQLLIQTRLEANSFKRLALTCGLTAATYLATTSDLGSRWTYNLTEAYLTQDDPEVAGWLPEKGGILYSAEMGVFYETFLKNPNGDWRYILGYEATIMPKEDFETYHKIRWNFGDYKAYKPWVEKMRPEDRLVIRSTKSEKPNIPELEWKYPVSGIWIGRPPRTKSISPTATPASTSPVQNEPGK